MESFKKILTKLLFPPTVVIIVLTPVATALVIYALIFEEPDSLLSYIAYMLSAYALTVICTKAPILWQRIKNFKKDNKYIKLYLSDPHLRIKLSLYGSVTMNSLYGLMQLISGFYFRSIWFYALAAYYGLLGLMRYFLLKETKKTKPLENLFREYLHYRFCGVLLLIMNMALSVIVSYIVWQNRGFQYHSIHTITMAAYTFTAMTVAIVNVVKYRRTKSPLMIAAKVISFASALVSVLSLETAMLSAFGSENSPQFRRIMTATTGGAVLTIVLVIAIYMIVHSTKEINIIKGKLNK